MQLAQRIKTLQAKDEALRETKLSLQRKVNEEVHKQLAIQETVKRFVHNKRSEEQKIPGLNRESAKTPVKQEAEPIPSHKVEPEAQKEKVPEIPKKVEPVTPKPES